MIFFFVIWHKLRALNDLNYAYTCHKFFCWYLMNTVGCLWAVEHTGWWRLNAALFSGWQNQFSRGLQHRRGERGKFWVSLLPSRLSQPSLPHAFLITLFFWRWAQSRKEQTSSSCTSTVTDFNRYGSHEIATKYLPLVRDQLCFCKVYFEQVAVNFFWLFRSCDWHEHI